MATKKTDKSKEVKYAEQLDIPRVTLAEAREQIELTAQSKQHRGAIVLVGEAGMGKTQIFHQVAKKLGYDVTPIHTAQFGLMGGGIPRKAEGDFFDIAVPSIFPQPGQKSIVLFDEINRGLKHAISMFFNLLEDRTMFNYRLPDDCVVAATMNPATAGYAVTAIESEPAIRRRVKFLYVIPSYSGWLEYAASDAFHRNSLSAARGKACHPSILGYFKQSANSLYDKKAKEQNKQYTCPATIETISEDAWNIEASGKHSLHDHFAHTRFSSSIGLTMSSQLCAYIKDHTVMLGADDVLYKYSSVKKRVKQMVKKSLHEPLADLSGNVLQLLFAETPPLKKTSKNFLDFCIALPNEMAANMLYQMKEVAAQSNAESYMHELMGALQDYDDWIDLQVKIDKSHRSVDDGLRSQ